MRVRLEPGTGQRSLILTPNKYGMLTLTFCNFLNVVDDDDDGAVVIFFRFCIRPSNVHAYTREVRSEHASDRVARRANYGVNGSLVTASEGNQLPIDPRQVPYGTTQPMQKRLSWSYVLFRETSSNCQTPDHCL